MFVRSLTPADRDAVIALIGTIENFNEEERDVAIELIDGALEPETPTGYRCQVVEDDGRVCGYLCWGRTPMTARTFDLYWVAVDRRLRSRGLGRALCLDLEARVASAGGGNIRIETSSKESYGKTLQFYLDLGYIVAARLADFYDEGDELITLYKQLPASR